MLIRRIKPLLNILYVEKNPISELWFGLWSIQTMKFVAGATRYLKVLFFLSCALKLWDNIRLYSNSVCECMV